MPKNPPPPICPKCRKAKHFLVHKTGGRKFQCLDCEGDDPLRSPELAKLPTGELRPLDGGVVGVVRRSMGLEPLNFLTEGLCHRLTKELAAQTLANSSLYFLLAAIKAASAVDGS